MGVGLFAKTESSPALFGFSLVIYNEHRILFLTLLSFFHFLFMDGNEMSARLN